MKAVKAAIVDYGNASFGSKADGRGLKTPESARQAVLSNIIAQVEASYAGVQKFRSRCGSSEYVAGDSYAAPITQGDHVMAIVDPSYYKTTGYQEAIVGPETYAKTHDLLAKLAEAQHHLHRRRLVAAAGRARQGGPAGRTHPVQYR